MTPYDLETVVRAIKEKRSELLPTYDQGATTTYALGLVPLICTMLETLLQHEADKCRALIAAGVNRRRP